MTRHYFQTELTSSQEKRLRAIFDAREERRHGTRRVEPITPAELERRSGEHDTIEEFLAGLESTIT